MLPCLCNSPEQMKTNREIENLQFYSLRPRPGGGGCIPIPGILGGGVCHPVLQMLTLFRTKKCHFSHPFSDLASKIHTHSQTWPLRNYVIVTRY